MINIFFDVWLYIDILLSLRTGVPKDGIDGDILFNIKEIRKEYFKFWFWVDLLATIPWNVLIQALLIAVRFVACSLGGTWLMASSNGISVVYLDIGRTLFKIMRFMKLLKVLKMFRIARIMKILKLWEDIIDVQYEDWNMLVGIMQPFCLIVMWLHISACFNYYCTLEDSDYEPFTWICKAENVTANGLSGNDRDLVDWNDGKIRYIGESL